MNNNILCSIALFNELYKSSSNNVFTIIAEFIKAAISIDKTMSFTDVDIANKLEVLFNIKAPKSVIKYAIKHHIGSDITKKDGVYIVSPDFANNDSLNQRLCSLQYSYNLIFEALCNYIETVETRTLNSIEKNKIKDEFIEFIINKECRTYQNLISAYIIQHRGEDAFVKALNDVSQGIVVFTGIQYSEANELANQGKWDDEITFILDTEQLFNIGGLNDEYYHQISLDLLGVVQEINQAAGRSIIKLRYFPEAQREIDAFFGTAECIINGKAQFNPSKVAMGNILNNCKDEFDVKAKKSKLYSDLKGMGIICDDSTIIKPIWNIGNQELLQKIEQEFNRKHIEYDEDKIVTYFDILSKINTLRNGNNQMPFEKIKYVFISANNLVHYIAKHETIKAENETLYTAKIDFVISKLWFKLRKSFNGGGTPASFDIIARSQAALASKYSESINQVYDELCAKDLSNEAKIDIYNELRAKGYVASADITPDNLPEIISFIEQPSISDIQRNIAIKNEKLAYLKEIEDTNVRLMQENYTKDKENNIIKEELSILKAENASKDRKQRTIINKPIKSSIKSKAGFYIIITHIVCAMIAALIMWGAFICLVSPQDSLLSIVGFYLTLVSSGVVGMYIYCIKWCKQKIRTYAIKSFKTNMYH